MRLAKQRTRQANFTFGFLRAEILGAFANAVFLLALCFTIILDAIQRFVKPEVIENPDIVLIVGCVGLFTNLVGMVLFGGHGDHNHGGHSHGHTHSHSHSPRDNPRVPSTEPAPTTASPLLVVSSAVKHDNHDHHDRKPSQTSEPPSPMMHYSAHQRAFVMATEDRIRSGSNSSAFSAASGTHKHDSELEKETVITINDPDHKSEGNHNHDREDENHNTHSHHGNHHDDDHHQHGHSHHGHEQRNMNIHGLFLHVLGDALGSIGVIVSSLIIMFASGSWRYYMDPVISLLISGLIISSAAPLVRSASFVLLQGVPTSISVARLREQILSIDGVFGVHELHVWGLSDNRNVASVHVRVAEGASARPYMEVAAAIKRLMHGCGVHSTTVQPEFFDTAQRMHRVGEDDAIAEDIAESNGCLLKCEGDGCNEQRCCPEEVETVSHEARSPNSQVNADNVRPVEMEMLGIANDSAAFLLSGSKKAVPIKLGKRIESTTANNGSPSSHEIHPESHESHSHDQGHSHDHDH
ncbi:hypothetical protein HDU83_008484 [Entophlyctis luteolus]|nr:hypothetical protein HDU83_008484 [Entophlyctis luteolus]